MRYVEFKQYKKGKAGQLKGKDAFKKKSKPGGHESPHPARGKLVGESLYEADARIQHAEDIIFWEGSKGAMRVLEALRNMAKEDHKNVTLKWDGSPALIFGRNENGEFILTDKSGFVKKGGIERATSGTDLEQMLLGRSGGANRDKPDRIEFAGNMKDIFDEYEKATPKDFRGYLMGDLLYYNTPEIKNGKYIFTPNIVTYEVATESDIGKRIAQSKTGVVVHRLLDEEGNQSPVPQNLAMLGTEVFIFPSVTVSKAATIDDNDINTLKATVAKDAQAIDSLLNKQELIQLKMTDLPKIFYTYLNSTVDSGITDYANGFMAWLKTSKVSGVKQQRIAEYVGQKSAGYNAMWNTVAGIMQLKDKIINQFDSHDADVKAHIGDHGPVDSSAHGDGGEGYVMTHPEGDIKLVSRGYFTKANRSIKR